MVSRSGVDWQLEADRVAESGQFCVIHMLLSRFIESVAKLECGILMDNEIRFASLLADFKFITTLQELALQL